MIDWAHFTPWLSLCGGLLIGLSASLFILLSGRILGVSGILGGLIKTKPGQTRWRVAFLLGMATGALVLYHASSHDWLSPISIDADYGTIGVAGILVGFGTRLGSGCTSGHGVCGISRLSGRSIVATVIFMLSGIITVYITHHLMI